MRMSFWWILVPRASVSFGHVVGEMCRKQSQTRQGGHTSHPIWFGHLRPLIKVNSQKTAPLFLEFSDKNIEFIDLRQSTLFRFISTGRKELDIGLAIGLLPG